MEKGKKRKVELIMIRTWPGQTKEEWIKEYNRDKALTPEERRKEWDEYYTKIKKENEERNVQRKKELEERSQKDAEWTYVNVESPNSLDNGEATVYWIIAMVVGSIFYERLSIWIIATALWLGRIFRHELRQWKWNHGGKEEYYKQLHNVCRGNKDE